MPKLPPELHALSAPLYAYQDFIRTIVLPYTLLLPILLYIVVCVAFVARNKNETQPNTPLASHVRSCLTINQREHPSVILQEMVLHDPT